MASWRLGVSLPMGGKMRAGAEGVLAGSRSRVYAASPEGDGAFQLFPRPRFTRWTLASSGLQVESKKKGKAVVVAIRGDAGMAFVGQLQQELSRVLEGKPELVVLDLTDLAF